eukprot:COSAG04_NODE_160_length_22034_cov_4.774151_8_plen_154_part_00
MNGYEERSFAKTGSGRTQKRRNVANERKMRVSKQGDHCSASIEVIRRVKATSIFPTLYITKTLPYLYFYQDRPSPKWMRELTQRSVLFCAGACCAAGRTAGFEIITAEPHRWVTLVPDLCLLALDLYPIKLYPEWPKMTLSACCGTHRILQHR